MGWLGVRKGRTRLGAADGQGPSEAMRAAESEGRLAGLATPHYTIVVALPNSAEEIEDAVGAGGAIDS